MPNRFANTASSQTKSALNVASGRRRNLRRSVRRQMAKVAPSTIRRGAVTPSCRARPDPETRLNDLGGFEPTIGETAATGVAAAGGALRLDAALPITLRRPESRPHARARCRAGPWCGPRPSCWSRSRGVRGTPYDCRPPSRRHDHPTPRRRAPPRCWSGGRFEREGARAE